MAVRPPLIIRLPSLIAPDQAAEGLAMRSQQACTVRPRKTRFSVDILSGAARTASVQSAMLWAWSDRHCRAGTTGPVPLRARSSWTPKSNVASKIIALSGTNRRWVFSADTGTLSRTLDTGLSDGPDRKPGIVFSDSMNGPYQCPLEISSIGSWFSTDTPAGSRAAVHS